MQCLGSGAAPCARCTCSSLSQLGSKPGTAWLRRARRGAGWACSASAQAEFVCLGTKPWSSWLRAGWWFALSGCRSGPHVLHRALCCWGSASVDAQSWRSWRSSRDCAGPRTECEVWFKLSWLRSGGSSAVGLGVLGLVPPQPCSFIWGLHWPVQLAK